MEGENGKVFFHSRILSFHLSLVSPLGASLHVIDKGLVDHPEPAWGRVVTAEIPVAIIVGTALAQVFDGLINDIDIWLGPFWCNDGGNHVTDVLILELVIQLLYYILLLVVWFFLSSSRALWYTCFISFFFPSFTKSASIALKATNSPIRDMSMP